MFKAYLVQVAAGYANPMRIATTHAGALGAAHELCDHIREFDVRPDAWSSKGQPVGGGARLYISEIPWSDGAIVATALDDASSEIAYLETQSGLSASVAKAGGIKAVRSLLTVFPAKG